MTRPTGKERRLRVVADPAGPQRNTHPVHTLLDPVTTHTVWIVELATLSEPRHIHGVYTTEATAIAAVVDLLTTRFVSRWATANVRIPNLFDFPTIDGWNHAVIAAWTLVDPLDVAIAWDEWEPQ